MTPVAIDVVSREVVAVETLKVSRFGTCGEAMLLTRAAWIISSLWFWFILIKTHNKSWMEYETYQGSFSRVKLTKRLNS